MRSTADLAANLAICRDLTAQAVSAGARMVLLPECFSLLGQSERDRLAVAEVLEHQTGPVMATLTDLAAKHGIWLIGGGTPEAIPSQTRRSFNTAVVVDPRGTLVSRYRKIHLFDVDIPGNASLRESDATAGGTEPVVVTIDGVRVGISICYDLRFPELYRKLVKDLGAEVIVVPAAFTAYTGAAHWHVLLRARAIENQAWVIAAAQWGKHNEKRESYGHTIIVDPWGTIIAERPAGDGVVTATLRSEVIEACRNQMPCLQHAALWKTLP